MSEATPTEQEVQSVVRKELEVLTTPPYRSYGPPEDLPYVTNIAVIQWLYSLGYITDPFRLSGSGSLRAYSLTPEGWAYWERLRLGPTRYWLKHNWFPVAVAVISSITGIGAIVVGVLTLLLKD